VVQQRESERDRPLVVQDLLPAVTGTDPRQHNDHPAMLGLLMAGVRDDPADDLAMRINDDLQRDHEARGGHERDRSAEVGLRDGVRAAAVRMRLDDLAVRNDQHQQQDREHDNDGKRVADRRGAGDRERGHDRLGPVRHRGQRIRRERGEAAGHTEALTVALAVPQRDARLAPAGPQNPFAHHASSAVSGVTVDWSDRSAGGWLCRSPWAASWGE
jgi:hypothetical protein